MSCQKFLAAVLLRSWLLKTCITEASKLKLYKLSKHNEFSQINLFHKRHFWLVTVRKSCVNDKINDSWFLFSCFSFSVLVLYWNTLIDHSCYIINDTNNKVSTVKKTYWNRCSNMTHKPFLHREHTRAANKSLLYTAFFSFFFFFSEPNNSSIMLFQCMILDSMLARWAWHVTQLRPTSCVTYMCQQYFINNSNCISKAQTIICHPCYMAVDLVPCMGGKELPGPQCFPNLHTFSAAVLFIS